MPETDTDLHQEVPAEDIAEAKEMGWVPQEEFRGDKSKWIDAPTFLARGRDVMPLLRKNNERLRGENKQSTAKIKELEKRLADGEESVKELLEFHKTNLATKVKEARKVLLTQITEAKDSEDPEALGNAIAELSAFDVDQAVAKVKGPTNGTRKAAADLDEDDPPATPKIEPWFQDWLGENTWADESHDDYDPRRTRMANVISGELRADKRYKDLKGAAFLDKVTEMTDKELGTSHSRVEDGGHRPGGGGGDGKTFNDLPKEAKDTARRQAPKMVGDGRAFKTEKDWFKHYADTFFA